MTSVLDRARIERAVWSYDFWLDLRGTPGRRRRRRGLRRELRANLVDAGAVVGTRVAVAGQGGTRATAAAAGEPDADRPRWSAGLQAGVSVAVATVVIQLFAALWWVDGAFAATSSEPVRGSLFGFPGSSVAYLPGGRGFAVEVVPGWTGVLLGVAVLLLVARPWRALRRPRLPGAARAG